MSKCVLPAAQQKIKKRRVQCHTLNPVAAIQQIVRHAAASYVNQPTCSSLRAFITTWVGRYLKN